MNLRQLLPADIDENMRSNIPAGNKEIEDDLIADEPVEFNEAEFIEQLIQNHQNSQSNRDITTTKVSGTAWSDVSFRRARGVSAQGDAIMEEELSFTADGFPITRKSIHESLIHRCPQSMHIISKESLRECSHGGGHPCCVFCSEEDDDGVRYCEEHMSQNPLRHLGKLFKRSGK